MRRDRARIDESMALEGHQLAHRLAHWVSFTLCCARVQVFVRWDHPRIFRPAKLDVELAGRRSAVGSTAGTPRSYPAARGRPVDQDCRRLGYTEGMTGIIGAVPTRCAGASCRRNQPCTWQLATGPTASTAP